MTESADSPPGVELRWTDEEVVARHEPSGVVCHGESVADALCWLAEGVALQMGAEGDIGDPATFLADATAAMD